MRKKPRSRPGSASDRRRWRARLMERQGGLCCHCSRPMRLASHNEHAPDIATLDHIVPLSKGGANGISNFALACEDCNSRRGNQDFDAWQAWMRLPSAPEPEPPTLADVFLEAPRKREALRRAEVAP